MKKRIILLGFFAALAMMFIFTMPGGAAYKTHDSDYDTGEFVKAYPAAQDTKLDNCYLCHTGGSVNGKYLDACDYCHAVYGFKPPHGDIKDTLNPFGLAYLTNGRNADAFKAIADIDSDGDGFTNAAEIAANRLPGDKNDNPNVQEAPSRTFSRKDLRNMPKITQFMAVDTAKAGDFFGEYSGIDMWGLLQAAGVTDDATDVTVFAADGYSRNFLISDLKKDYDQGQFLTEYPWLRFPENSGFKNGDRLPGKLRYLLAYERDGFPLMESKIVADSNGKYHLDGEGPYRFVTPLTEPCVPDRSQWTVDRDDSPYPYNPNRPTIRNGDYCIKAIVAIRVNTKENKSYQYDWSGKKWKMVKNGELVVYGTIRPSM